MKQIGKKLRQVTALLLGFVFVMSISNVNVKAASGNNYSEKISGITWLVTVDSEDSVSIKPMNKDELSGEITIPRTVAGYHVTTIAASAFYGNRNVTKIVIPDGVKTISSTAFAQCTSLQDVVISDSVKDIGVAAFLRCYELKNIKLPKNLVTLDALVFNECKGLESVTLPDSKIEQISYNAFSDCNKLTNFVVDTQNANYSCVDGVVFTKDGKCLMLFPTGRTGSYNVPEGTENIGECAFSNCNLRNIALPESIHYIGEYSFYYNKELETVNIPKKVTTLENNTFEGCANLNHITIPETVTEIKEYAFGSCTALDDISIPADVTDIHNTSFFSCSSLMNFNVGDGNPNYSSKDGVLYNKTADKLISYPAGRTGDYHIPAFVTTIGRNAIFGSSLKIVYMPKTVTAIEFNPHNYLPFFNGSLNYEGTSEEFNNIDVVWEGNVIGKLGRYSYIMASTKVNKLGDEQ